MYAYACLYQSDTDRVMEVDPEEITLTFVCMRYPRKLLGHLKKARGMKVSRQGDGIYYLEGDALAMQLLVTRELSERQLLAAASEGRPEGGARAAGPDGEI